MMHVLKRYGLLSLTLLTSLCLSAADQPAEPSSHQKTFSMIKPSAVQDRHIGGIVEIIERSGLRVVAMKMQKLTREQAERFYAEHKERSFFNDLVTTMSSGPIVAMVIEGNNSIFRLREIVGATDPQKAVPGSIRAIFGKSVSENSIHASDSESSAAREVPFFFSEEEIFNFESH
jgi:nucleoside-diphosphate kinase